MKNKEEDIKLTPSEENKLNEALKIYEKGEYEKALQIFQSLIDSNKDLEYGLRYPIYFCKNVTGKSKNTSENHTYQITSKVRSGANWLWIPAIFLALPIFKLFVEESTDFFSFSDFIQVMMSVVLFIGIYKIHNSLPYGSGGGKIRCKHCGAYTYYISPNEGLAYFNSNNCNKCGRGYPMPSSYWDTNTGQAYMYERGSVTEKEFYKEFEEMNPEYPKSDMAHNYLGRKKK